MELTVLVAENNLYWQIPPVHVPLQQGRTLQFPRGGAQLLEANTAVGAAIVVIIGKSTAAIPSLRTDVRREMRSTSAGQAIFSSSR